MLIELKDKEKHVVIDNAMDHDKIYINLCAFLVTDMEQISFIITKKNVKEFNQYLASMKDCTIFQFTNLHNEVQEVPVMFLEKFDMFLRCFNFIKDSEKVFLTYYLNDEDNESLAVMTAIKGDQYDEKI